MKLFNKLFGCSNREIIADEALRHRDEEHDTAMRQISQKVMEARRAAVESRTATRTLLKRLSEDIPQ